MYSAMRYMRNTYPEPVLGRQMKALYDAAMPHKFSMFFQGLTGFMSSPLVLPDAPPLVKWIEQACMFARQWLMSLHSKATIDPETQQTMFLMPGPVPTDISLYNHDAMLQLRKSTLGSEDWAMTTPHSACDNLGKASVPQQGEATGSLPLPPSASAVAVQSEIKSSDPAPPLQGSAVRNRIWRGCLRNRERIEPAAMLAVFTRNITPHLYHIISITIECIDLGSL